MCPPDGGLVSFGEAAATSSLSDISLRDPAQTSTINSKGPVREVNGTDIVKACAALGNPVRYRILQLILRGNLASCCNRIGLYENGCCVTDVVDSLNLAQSTISHHLGILQKAGLVVRETRGPFTCYFANHAGIQALLAAMGAELVGKTCCPSPAAAPPPD